MFFLLREVVSMWKGQKPDANYNETAESLAYALKHFKEANAQPQNSTTTRLRYKLKDNFPHVSCNILNDM